MSSADPVAATVPDLLQRRLASDPSRPFVTFYDDATGERTELSVITYANWVAKTANLLTDELMLDPGDTVRLDLPAHWLVPVFLGAIWSAGLEVADPGQTADLLVVGPDELEALGDPETATSPTPVVLACALHPFATRFTTPLPPRVLDHGVLWAGQSDVFVPVSPSELTAIPDQRRVLTDLHPGSAAGRDLLLGLLAGGGSMVLVRNGETADEAQWPARSQSERATAVLRGD